MKIMMVCLGNICRSPLAEEILRVKLQERGINAIVDSTGTESFHVGQNPDKRAIEIGKKYGVDISQLVARQFSVADFKNFDKIFVMDAVIYSNVVSLARGHEDESKVDFLLNTIYPGSNRPVPDPYYGGQQGFEEVFSLVDEACEKIAESLVKTKAE